MDADDLRARKAQVRDAMRAARGALAADERARRSRAMEARLLDLIARLDPRAVMIFLSFGSEIDTHGAIAALGRAGRRLALPVVAGRDLRAAAFSPGDPVRPTAYGAAEPAISTAVPPGEIDVVVVPGLAFDPRGHRVGYGRGYYDRFLRLVRADVPRIGVAFQLQVVPEVPRGPDDTPVDAVVTDVEVVRCRPERRPGVIPE